jgi:hypothetical protein
MTYVGAFATSDIGPDLLVVMSIHRPPRDIVKLCRLSDGHCFSLNPSRVHILENGCVAFENHARDVVNKARNSSNSSMTVTDVTQDSYDWLAEYIKVMDESSASYRRLPLTTYIIHKEFERSYYSAYTTVDCWRHVRHMCELHGIDTPTVSVVRSRLGQFANQCRAALIYRFR